MDQCTENYECLVINNNAKSNKLSDQVFWYKADPHPDFQIGAPSYWLYSKNNFSNEQVQKEENYGVIKKPIQVNKLYQ